jgi:hypothetical protein
MIDFLKVFVGLAALAVCINLGFAAAGAFGAVCGVAVWWLFAALSEA